MAMSDDDGDNGDARVAQAPPLTVTASSPVGDEKSSDDEGRETSGEQSRSRISDHVELPPQSDNNNNNRNAPPQVGPRRGGGGGARRPGGPRRVQGPEMKWHKDYAAINPHSGRVLFIDFAKKDNKGSHIRKVAAQEIFSLDSLRRAYRSQGQDQSNQPAMRVIHVQNADWAIPFLLRKFDIDINNDDTIGADFGRYIRYRKPELRGGKPFLNGKTWKVRYDPWRGVNKTSFGMDYAKSFRTSGRAVNRGSASPADRIMQLNDFDENDEAICAHDVYVQRLSCYVQHKQASDRISAEELPSRRHFYPVDVDEEVPIVNGDLKDKAEYKSRLRYLDNGNVIIIFDNSYSGSFEDTLIAARREWECRWRRLPFYLAFEARDAIEDDDEKLSLQSSKAILSDIFKAVVTAWDGFLDHAVTHMTILEDKIYDQPADESRAPELWSNSSSWLKMEKLLNVHISVMHEMKMRLHELTDDIDTEDNWLEDSPGDFDRLNNLIAEDLTKPTESLISLLYQSVSIRDSRHSLELGLSMWRLSWITFIFLPLTFIVGFFGMNVDTFVNNPSIKWYFIAAIPFMIGIVAFYFMMKRLASINRRTPYERTVYRNFFEEMASASPSLWSRGGPREYVRPKGRIARIKWSLIRHWLKPGKTIRVDVADEVAGGSATGHDSLGLVSHVQRWFSRRWTQQISSSLTLDTELGLMDDFTEDWLSGEHSVGEGLVEVAEVLGASAAPAAGHIALPEHDPTRLTVPGTLAKPSADAANGGPWADPSLKTLANPVITAAMKRQRARSNSDSSRRPRSSGSGGRNSTVLVEEEDVEWLNERGRKGKDWLWRRSVDSDRRKSSSGSRPRNRAESAKDGEKEKKPQG